MDREITSASLQRLLGIGQSVLNDLAKRGIIVRGTKRGSYALEPSVVGYCSHLREIAAGRGGDAGGDARAGLGSAQADLAEAKAARMRGETVNASDVEKQWTGKMREFRIVRRSTFRFRRVSKPTSSFPKGWPLNRAR
jgi:phage terminase Nu1 subunit (DNA packaging protein)